MTEQLNKTIAAILVAGLLTAGGAMAVAPDTACPVRERAPLRTYGRATRESEDIQSLRKHAEEGQAWAQNNLGVSYERGKGVPQDDAEAVKWYRRAAEQGHANAQHNLGVMYGNGRGVLQDNTDAVKWYHRALRRFGTSRTRSDAEAVKWYRRAAEQGHAVAQCNLGVSYERGKGVPQDDAEAVKWYRRAAEQGTAAAQCNLGLMYANGKGIPQDDAEAVKWYSRAAEQGYANAQISLGLMCTSGRGVPQNYTKAVKWYRRAAEQGHAVAQNNLGLMHANGWGVPQDDAEAVKWCRRAAEQGFSLARDNLSRMYAENKGVLRNDAETVLCRYTDRRGNSESLRNVVAIHADGEKIPQDNGKETEWRNRAAPEHSEEKTVLGGADELLAARIRAAGGIQGRPALMECAGIYVIFRPDDKHVKVGKTGDFRNRFGQLAKQCGSMGHPEIIPVVLFPVNKNRGAVEELAHAKLREYRTSGEWFVCDVDTAIRAVLDSLPRNGN